MNEIDIAQRNIIAAQEFAQLAEALRATMRQTAAKMERLLNRMHCDNDGQSPDTGYALRESAQDLLISIRNASNIDVNSVERATQRVASKYDLSVEI